MKIKYIAILLILLCFLIGAASAADDGTVDSLDAAQDDAVSIDAVEEADEVASTEPTSTQTDEKLEQSNDEILKTGTNTVEVTNINTFRTAINNAVQDSENDTYIINLNAGTYKLTSNIAFNPGQYAPNIIINANGQAFTGTSYSFQFKNGCNITINDAIFGSKIENNYMLTLNNADLRHSTTNNGNLFIANSKLNSGITNNNNLTILDGNTFGSKLVIKGSGNIAFNDPEVVQYISDYNGNYILENVTISSTKTNNGNLTIRNSTISKKITNNGNLTIYNSTMNEQIVNNGILTIGDDAIFGKSFTLSGGGQIIINDPNRIAPYLSIYNGVYVIENAVLTTQKTNNGNLTIRKSTITATITNNGNLTIENSTINAQITNNGILTIADDVVFGNSFMVIGDGKIIINDPNRIALYTERVDGNVTFANVDLSSITRNNYGNLTIINSTVKSINNYGTLTFKNSTITGTVQNMLGATLIFEDDVIFGDNVVLSINAQSTIIINDTSKLVPYLSVYRGNWIIENQNIKTYEKTNEGNLTIRNSTIDTIIYNYGNLTIINSTILYSLFNYGNVTIINSTITTSAGYLNSDVKMIIINSTVNVRQSTNNGDLDIINSTLELTNKGLTNTGNVFMDNSTLTSFALSSNSRKMTVKNSIIDNSIANTGTLIIEGNTTFTKGISGEGTIIAEDINKYFNKIGVFTGETVIELGNYTRSILNSGNLTIENSTLNSESSYLTSENRDNGRLILINTTVNSNWANSGVMELYNVTINSIITNTGTLIISDDTIFGENFKITGNGNIIINDTQRVADFLVTYTGNIVLNNKTITDDKTNKGTLTLINCTIDSTIKNDGIINIADDVIFGPNAKITGEGEIVTNDITRLLPIIDAINGNYLINDAVLSKTYIFDGIVTLNNCTITNPDNINYGMLTLKNCTVDVGEDNTFLTNFGTVTISKDTKITGKIEDLVEGVIYEGAPKTWIVNDKTINIYFGSGGYLTSRVNPGDTLDFRGTIRPLHSLIINKPVNIISSTKDSFIDLDSHAGSYFGENPGACFSITKDGAYTNVTGINFHNTQVWIYNTHHVTLDSISVVVENQRIGSGVGVTSIRQNSSYITVKNSYFHTTENEGSSTLVLAWADYCTIENNTIEGDGMVGNLLYLTTYNVANLPLDIVYNSHNKIINNRIRGPDTAAAICYGICISGYDNLVDNNTITYSGSGITFQWGSGVDGIEQDTCLFGSGENVVSNNKLYGGCGISAGDIIYNNYMEGTLSVNGAKAYNNTANGLKIRGDAEITNNTIYGNVIYNTDAKNCLLENNDIKGDISIPAASTNNVISNNNITGSVTLDGSFNNLTNNRIMTSSEYAVSSNKLGKYNNLTGNYLVANGKVGNDAVSLRDPSNVIASAGVATKVEVSVPGEVTVNKTVQVTVKLTDANGNPLDGQVTVSSALGSETVNVTKGTGVYQYTPKAIGEDTISVKFAGNDTFYLSSNSSNVNVIAEKAPAQQNETKTPTKTPAKTVVSLSFVKAPKKVSKKAKKLIISAKLKVNGKLVAGKKLTFKFKGKTFKVKTNKKGVAKLTIKSKVLKKLLKKVKAGKKVKYQVSYGKKTVKKTLKVKK